MSLLASEKIMVVPAAHFGTKALLLPRSGHAASLVEVYDDPSDVMPIWQELLSVAPASAYQTPGFLLPWLATRGAEAGISAQFIVQRSEDGSALAMFCFGIKQFGLFRAALFLGAKDSNFNFGLFRPGYAPDTAELAGLFRIASKKMGAKRPDLMLLYNQPLAWNGWSNPLAALPRQWSPSFAYLARIGTDAGAYFAAKLSKDTRKKYRKKEARLAEIGSLRHLCTEDGAPTREKIVAAFFEQKIARFEIQNIEAGFKSPVMRRFVEDAILMPESNVEGRLELHALFCGEDIVAVYGGARHQAHFSAFFNSFNSDPEISKSSPGDLLLLKLITAKCAEGVSTFDLGIGEARYKNMICNETVPLFDSFVPVTLKGRIVAAAFSMSLRLKRGLKQNPKAFKLARRMRTAFSAKF